MRRGGVLRGHMMSSEEPWYKKEGGLSFSCTMCGNCCSGSPGSVRFTESEAESMAAKLDVSTTYFYDKYARREVEGEFSWLELKEVPTPAVEHPDGLTIQSGLDCIFLDREAIPGKAVCSLYDARPLQCRSWPFWSEIVESEDDWIKASQGAEGCPGLGKGVKYSVDEIQESVRVTEEYRDELDEELAAQNR